MKSPLSSVLRRNRFLQALAALVGLVFLNAIAEGIWDLMLEPVFGWLGNAMLTASAWTFGNFADSMYSEVSRDPHTNFSRELYVAFTAAYFLVGFVLAGTAWQMLSRLGKEVETENEDVEKAEQDLADSIRSYRRVLFLVLIPLLAIVMLWTATDFVQHVHASDAAVFVDRSIEILAPTMDRKETLRLRASFRSIETADDFYQLEEQLRSKASANGITLPDFESIR